MGWQDREWARWSDEERDRYLGTSSGRRGTATFSTAHGRRRSILTVLLLSALIAAAVHWHLLASAPFLGSGSGSKIVHINPSEAALADVPVTQPTSWGMSDPRFGGVGVLVQPGDTPFHALKLALAARGYVLVH